MRYLGTFYAPVVASLPATGQAGQLVSLSSNGVLYAWTGGSWSAVGASGTAIVDFGAGALQASVAVADATIVASSAVVASLMIAATTDHSADEHLVEDLEVFPGPAAAGTGFTIYARTRGTNLLRGKFNVSWSWS